MIKYNLRCCCPCSTPVIIGFVIGSLLAGIALATVLSMYLVDSSKTKSLSTNVTTVTTSTSTTGTTTTATTTTTTSATTTTTTSTTTTAPYCTTRVTFDDISGQSSTSGIVPNGYKNLNWTNVMYLNASTMPTSGYQTITTSPPFVGYNPGGATVMITTANGTKFAFNSVVVSSAWRDNLAWSIYGFRAGTNVVAGSFTMSVLNKTIISCGACSNWDTIYFTSSGGTPRSGLAENGTEFAFDDLCISFGY
ncbi:unnamed protein product [Rotaria sordida]|uniref:Uncharacterized protein n=1 Tax=Rotaria sordida TaxID=392033 RepID=A0A819NC59_9BILA|nr:unnamed protein product [Rotaria sordida]